MKKYIIKDANLVDGNQCDILIESGYIKKIASHIDISDDVQVLQCPKDTYVSSGWIDMHVHCFQKFELYADNCEEIGYKKGVTRVVDAGTSGADNVDEFYEATKNCKTYVHSLLNIAKTGIYAQNELANMEMIDTDAFKKALLRHPGFIVGVKARMSRSVVGECGDQPLYRAIEIANEVNLPLMIHIGTAPSALETVMKVARPHDIITHILNPKTNGIVENEKIKSCVFEAYKKGVIFDVGHGTDSFSFHTLDVANENNVRVDTISTDIYHRNRKNGPVYDLATTMTKFLNYGYSLQEVVDRVTSRPADVLHFDKVGYLKEGYLGDLTFFKVINDHKTLVDSTKTCRDVSRYILPTAVLLKGEYIVIGG